MPPTVQAISGRAAPTGAYPVPLSPPAHANVEKSQWFRITRGEILKLGRLDAGLRSGFPPKRTATAPRARPRINAGSFRRRRFSATLRADKLAERVHDLHEISLRRHHEVGSVRVNDRTVAGQGYAKLEATGSLAARSNDDATFIPARLISLIARRWSRSRLRWTCWTPKRCRW